MYVYFENLEYKKEDTDRCFKNESYPKMIKNQKDFSFEFFFDQLTLT